MTEGGGDAESIALGGRLWLDNRNFINAKIQHAKVNQSDRSTNQAFPTIISIKIIYFRMKDFTTIFNDFNFVITDKVF